MTESINTHPTSGGVNPYTPPINLSLPTAKEREGG
jgi:hypothetical protein